MGPFEVMSRIAEKAPKSVLDIGCGDGRIAFQFADAGCAVTALDPVGKPQIGSGAAVSFVRTKIEDYVCSEPYDLVIANAVSHLVQYSPHEFIAKLKSLAKSDGCIYVSFLGPDDDWATRENSNAVCFQEAMAVFRALRLKTLFRSIFWHDGLTVDGKKKHWNYYRFLVSSDPE